MTVEELKNKIINKQIQKQFFIFRYIDNDFLPLQYFHEICRILNLQINSIDSLKDANNALFFEDSLDTTYDLYRCDELSSCKKRDDLCIICKKIPKDVETFYKDFIVDFPKLELWQIKDYVYSICYGIDEKKLDDLMSRCENDIFLIDNEISKLSLFEEKDRNFIFDEFINDNIFSHVVEYKIFDFINAVIKKDVDKLLMIYKNKDNIDIEPLGVLTLLYNNFRNIIKIQLTPNASPDSVGIPSNRFWAIKHNNCGIYSKEELVRIFIFICSLDKKFKSGIVDNKNLIDYILINILKGDN